MGERLVIASCFLFIVISVLMLVIELYVQEFVIG